MSQTENIQKLLLVIEQKLGWGKSENWQGKDFENLGIDILDQTGVSLSASTLKRIFGKVGYNHLPSMTTLDTLAKFAGFENWRNFLKQDDVDREKTQYQKTGEEKIPVPGWRAKKDNRRWILVAIILIIAIISIAAIWATRKSAAAADPRDYSFGSEPLTHDIPNSVIFTYDATASPTDSVFIQQSWDARTRAAVKKDLHTYTSLYYEPGFFQAKLFVGNKIVKEHPLLIPTKGWLGLITNKPVPVYLKPSEFQHADSLDISVDDIRKNGIAVTPQPPFVKFYNVGNFDPVPADDFLFSALVKNKYSDGAAACQLTYIFLITDDAPVMIPLAIKGCVSGLMLRSFDEVVSGKNADLSGFGVDFSDWVTISCKSIVGKVGYFVNEKQVYQTTGSSKKINVIGLGFYFQGTGAVKNIKLFKKDQQVFSAF